MRVASDHEAWVTYKGEGENRKHFGTCQCGWTGKPRSLADDPNKMLATADYYAHKAKMMREIATQLRAA